MLHMVISIITSAIVLFQGLKQGKKGTKDQKPTKNTATETQSESDDNR